LRASVALELTFAGYRRTATRKVRTTGLLHLHV
jgi:hypothetical protein